MKTTLVGFVFALFAFTNFTAGQTAPPLDPLASPTPPESIGTLPAHPDDLKGAYNKPETSAADEHKGRITYGKKEETMVVTESSKPVEIKKTKFGSADASEPTGVFKGSLLDSSIDFMPKARVAPDLKAKTAAQVQASPIPKPATSVPPPTAPATFDITTGVNPAASASPSPHR